MDLMGKKNIVCINCGKIGHEFRYCRDAITSFGIINFKILDHQSETNFFKEKFNSKKNFYIKVMSHKYHDVQCYLKDSAKKNNDSCIYYLNNDGIIYRNIFDLKKFVYYSEKIMFLMISRKFSLGFVDFIRGKYNVSDTNTIINLFQQMTEDEIRIIEKSNYDDLLYYFLNRSNETKESILNKIYESKYSNEYCDAKIKFNMLSCLSEDSHNLIPWDLKFYTKNIRPKWKEPEWGFPKGRRDKKYEENLSCACREFEEETGMSNSDYMILNKIHPIEENLIGTNGISYKHIYYLSISNHDSKDQFDEYDANEIGSIKWFTYDEAITHIRPYHQDKKKVLTKAYLFIMNKLILS